MTTFSEFVPARPVSAVPGRLGAFVRRMRVLFGPRHQTSSYADAPFIGL